MDAQMVLWTRYELSQTFGPSTPRRTKIRPSPGRQTSASVDQRPPTTTKNQQVRRGARSQNAGPGRWSTDLRRLILRAWLSTGRPSAESWPVSTSLAGHVALGHELTTTATGLSR